MNNVILKRFIYTNFILGLVIFVSFIYDIRLSEFDTHLITHLVLGTLQFILLSATLLYFRHLMKEVHKEHKKTIEKCEKLDKLKDLLVDCTPTGLIFLSSNGIIEYVNPAIGHILGSTKTVGLNVFELDTIKKSRMYDGILNASKGIFTELLGEHYTSYTSHAKKVLNVYIHPIIDESTKCVPNMVMFIHDITNEHSLKVELENTYISTIKVLAELVDARDKYTGKHSENVSTYASCICDELGLEEETKVQIRIAANIHDIGKIAISDNILNKPDMLSLEEYESIKQHPVIGAEVLNKITGFRDISTIIRHHHERWDGSGYPSCLKGEKIPLGSQIIGISDAFDAMTTDRVYRKSLGKEKAIQILIEEKGRQFNPKLVDAFLNHLILNYEKDVC